MNNIIEVKNIKKTYGSFTAVDGISLSIKKGEIFGIAGPNGAGKSTTVEAMMGLRKPDSGSISVLGMNPQKQRSEVAQRIGIQLQQASLPDRMKVWEALDLFSSFYDNTVPWEPLLEQWGLGDKRNAAFASLSGGQKQRLFISLALVNDPDIVFLDELTTGLDPQARRGTWELVSAIRDAGKTVVLVTHFMDEAETLCDRIGIIDSGKLIACDTPKSMIHDLGGEGRILFQANGNTPIDKLRAQHGVRDVQRKGEEVIVRGRTDGLVASIINILETNNVPFQNLRTEQPNLEDVFLALTGHEIRA